MSDVFDLLRSNADEEWLGLLSIVIYKLFLTDIRPLARGGAFFENFVKSFTDEFTLGDLEPFAKFFVRTFELFAC